MMPTVDDILRAQRRQNIFDRVSSGSSSTAPAPSVFERLSQGLTEPLPMEGRLSFLPAMVTPERGREWAVPGVLAGAWNAFTAPGRALRGEPVGEDEALNFAMSTVGGGAPMAPAGHGIAGIPPWHGSPHRFEPHPENPLGRFDTSKIGTGEGAQAYGHGLYFAENPGVATGYQKQLADSFYTDKTGALTTYGNAWTAAKDAARPFVQHPDHAREVALQLQTWVDSGKNALDFLKRHDVSPELKPAYEAAAKAFSDLKKHPGHLYKVDLPDEQIAKMLDWDKRMVDQPQAVKDVVNKLFGPQLKTRPVGPDLVDVHLYEHGGSLGTFPASKVPDVLANPADYIPLTGAAFYESSKLVPGAVRDKVAASEALRAAGIPGIRYLDQGSRAGGAGTSNFVVFDDKIPKILSRE